MLLVPANPSDNNSTLTASSVGLTVEVFSRVERVMSDIYADVVYAVNYNPQTGGFDTVRVRACFECDDYRKTAEVDATDDVLALYQVFQAEVERVAQAAALARRKAVALAALRTPVRGRTVTVARGRKVPKGTTGEISWIGAGTYGGTRVGVRDINGKVHFTDAKNVDVQVPAAALAEVESIYASA